MPELSLRPMTAADRPWVEALLKEHWGSPEIVVHGSRYRPADLPGLVAEAGEEPAGLVTYRIEQDACEIVTLNSLQEGIGVGRALVQAVRRAATGLGCRRLWLVTTNDNLPALRFYQKRGFQLTDLHPQAVAASRRHKPQIPQTGWNGIPIRDEIELSLPLNGKAGVS